MKVTVHRLTNGDPYAVEVRPRSTVLSSMDGDLVNIAISYPRQTTLHVILPLDVAISMLESLRLPALAEETRARSRHQDGLT